MMPGMSLLRRRSASGSRRLELTGASGPLCEFIMHTGEGATSALKLPVSRQVQVRATVLLANISSTATARGMMRCSR